MSTYERFCYMKDSFGGFVCRYIDKDYYLSDKEKPCELCFEGNLDEVSSYLDMSIAEYNISKPPFNRK